LAVVQVQTLPTVLLFPRNSDVFFKYRSPHRDAASLLRFMNSLCLRDGRPGRCSSRSDHSAARVHARLFVCRRMQPEACSCSINQPFTWPA
jgi:hypothetical protein